MRRRRFSPNRLVAVDADPLVNVEGCDRHSAGLASRVAGDRTSKRLSARVISSALNRARPVTVGGIEQRRRVTPHVTQQQDHVHLWRQSLVIGLAIAKRARARRHASIADRQDRRASKAAGHGDAAAQELEGKPAAGTADRQEYPRPGCGRVAVAPWAVQGIICVNNASAINLGSITEV